MKFLPVFWAIVGKKCLVVGAGSIAARKAELLHKAGGKLCVVAPEIGVALSDLAFFEEIELSQRAFVESDLDDAVCVIAATDDQDLNRDISRLAQARGIAVNVVDNPELCSFIMPSMIERGPIQIAISSGGVSPVLARMLRSRLESTIPGAYGELATLADEFRLTVKQALPNVGARRRFWESILDGQVAELVFSGKMEVARERLQQQLRDFDHAQVNGEVYLVGAGPGDPDLLTFKALRLMHRADVVVYDRLVSQPILDMVRRDAERIYAGKASANHAIPQENINQLLVRLAREGKRVLRLKGGDPFIFGRGGEELGELIDENIEFQVVPGITAASGCASYAGIPLTHRDYSQACIFVTGHRRKGAEDLNWKMLSHANQTVVFYMGLENVSRICESLKAHGRAANTPAALVEKGTTAMQRVFVGDLDSLPAIIADQQVRAPTLIMVGEVVALHNKLNWYRPGEEIGQI
ncbi:MAG: siroheme synthase CysG [Gammaproteobacteria bacterium]|jgi:uroporphyrin-III C-methyltransferase/precorrin-2 dehydrogenase/sirohydrochlorin ferrochelatase|nr:siroheme synthase CysG [Gammaproteobacteria bacterium]